MACFYMPQSQLEAIASLAKFKATGGAENMSDSHLADDLQWTPQAKAKLKNIPFFVRSQAAARIEHLARVAGLEVITVEFVEQARVELGQ